MPIRSLNPVNPGVNARDRRGQFYRRRDRRERADVKQYGIAPSDLIGTPHAFDSIAANATTATNFDLPANARLAFSHSVDVSEGDITVNVGPFRSFSHPDLLADVRHGRHFGEEGHEVSITRGAAAIAGTFTLYVLNGTDQRFAIATCTFT